MYLYPCLRTRRTRLGVLTHLFEGQEDRTGCTCLRTRRTELGVLTHLFEDQEDRTGCTYTLVSGPGGTPPRIARSCSLGCPAHCRDSHWGRAPSRLPPLHSWFAAGTKLDSMKKMNMPACQKPLPDPPRAKPILVSWLQCLQGLFRESACNALDSIKLLSIPVCQKPVLVAQKQAQSVS